MDEAKLCDRIALIQHGKILSIETPSKIIAGYPQKLYAIESENNYQLLLELRNNPYVNAAYIFGDSLHVTFNGELKTEKGVWIIENGNNQCQLSIGNYQLQKIQPTVEDCFINLMLV